MRVTATFEINRSDGDDLTPRQRQEVYDLIEAEIDGMSIQITVQMDGDRVEDELTITNVEVKGTV